MKRRASHPQLEPIEERVLTTVVGMHHAAGHVQRSRAHSAPQQIHHLWATITLTNDTRRSAEIYFKIGQYGDPWHKVINVHIAHNELKNFVVQFPVGHSLPTFRLTYYTFKSAYAAAHNLWDARSETILPLILDHHPGPDELASKGAVWYLQKDTLGTVILHNPSPIPPGRFDGFFGTKV